MSDIYQHMTYPAQTPEQARYCYTRYSLCKTLPVDVIEDQHG